MPYVNKKTREKLKAEKPINPGELNYAITSIVHEYVKDKGISYSNLNETIGVLECVKQEFYRKIVVPYEEKKIKENGDIEILNL